MKTLQIIIFLLITSLVNLSAATSQPKNPYLKEFSESGELLIEIPNFSEKSWERSLVTYPIEFNSANLRERDLILQNTEGKEIPFQLSDKRKDSNDSLKFGRMSFITDHKNGSIKTKKIF